MIDRSELVEVGRLAKPHGVKGEIAACFDADGDFDPMAAGHLFIDMDGLMVPFVVTAVRPKSADVVLLSLKGIDTDTLASALANKPVYIEKHHAAVFAGDDATDGEFYLEDLIGFSVTDGGADVGRIVDYDDSTENMLFVVETADGRSLLIPASDDLIEDIDTDARRIDMSLPAGLLSL